MVIDEGGEAHTINLCQQCYNEKRVHQGKQPLKWKEWKEVVEKKAHRGWLWKIFGSDPFLRGMWGCKEDSGGRCSTKTRRIARSVATGVSLQRGSGTSHKKSADADCNREIRHLGKLQRAMQERRKAL